jgi:N-acetylneuraminate lyase
MEKFNGIFPALLTPFDENDIINEGQLEKLVKFNLEKGAKGFYVCGSTAEAFLLSTDERKLVMDIVKSCAPKATLIAHVGSISEKQAIELGEYASRLGYDAVSSVAPFYYKFSFKEIKDYYFRVADSASLPMLVYHFPAFSGVNMGIKEISEFLSDERFLGIKYTSNDYFIMEQCKSKFPNKVVYNGYDETFLAGLSLGSDGGIGSTYNFMCDKFVKIKELFEQNRLSEARGLQREVNSIISVLCEIGVMAAEKEVLNQIGFDFGVCRKPFAEPTKEQKKLIAEKIIPYLQGECR